LTEATVSAILGKIEDSEENAEAVIRSGQAETKAAMYSIWSRLEETIRHLVEDSLASVDLQTQGLREKPNEKTEQTHSGLQAVMTSLDNKIQGKQIDIRMTNTLLETTRHGLKAKIAEVTDNFIHGLDLTGHELETQLNSKRERHKELVAAQELTLGELRLGELIHQNSMGRHPGLFCCQF
jgi:hypothetical protein